MKTELVKCVSQKNALSKRKQCDLLEISRGSIYYRPLGEKQENLDVMSKIDEHHLEHPTAGVLRMQDYLFSIGFLVNHKRVRRLMRKMGLMPIYPKRNLSKLGQAKYIKPYLLKGLVIDHPNQVWAIDITYIPMKKGFMYLTAIIDLYSRYVVDWNISNTLEAECSLNVLKNAISLYGKPEIINSDQGSQFTCEPWTAYLSHFLLLILPSRQIRNGSCTQTRASARNLNPVYLDSFLASISFVPRHCASAPNQLCNR